MIKKCVFCLALALAPLQAAQSVEAGKAAPDCQLSGFDDQKPYALKQFQGKVVYVDFWASWCGPCAKSFPFMNDLHAQYKDKGLQIIAVNLDENTEDAKSFLERFPAGFTVMKDTDSQCAKNFEVKAMPSSYLLDKKGVLHYINLGFRADETKELPALIEKLLDDTP